MRRVSVYLEALAKLAPTYLNPFKSELEVTCEKIKRGLWRHFLITKILNQFSFEVPSCPIVTLTKIGQVVSVRDQFETNKKLHA